MTDDIFREQMLHLVKPLPPLVPMSSLPPVATDDAMRAAYFKVRIKELETENAALRTALADAIRSPMGVVPASAEQFYDATKGTVKA